MTLHHLNPQTTTGSTLLPVQSTGQPVESLRPGDEGYDDAARVFFTTGRPAVVVRPRGPDDVATALDHAVRHDLAVSVRSGGHGALGNATNVDGMVVDLTHLDHVQVLDTDSRIVRIGAGATWGQVADRLDPHGWAITAGDTRGVGVGGLTLGGGVGWLVRRHGLAIDNLVGARVVTADGRFRQVSADRESELFWALRGGGGNFGVVVDLDFVAQDVPTVHFGTVTFRIDDPADLLRRWRDAMRAAPEELSTQLALVPGMGGAEPTAMLHLCFAGDRGTEVTEADAAIEPLLEIGTVQRAHLAERRYGEVLEDAEPPAGMRMAVRNTLVPDLDDELVTALADVHQGPAPMVLALRSLGGAFGRVPSSATAFAHRDAEVMVIGMAMLPGTATDDDVDRALLPWRDVAARGTGAYVNFQGAASAEDLAAIYPPATYARLQAIKRAYDPANLFAQNHNITPSRG